MFCLGSALLDLARFIVVPRQFSVMVYGDDSVNYDASCNVFRYGDRGFMYSITGWKFYEAWRKQGALRSLLAQLDVKSLEGYVTAAHARLMRVALRHVGRVEVTGEGEMAGHTMVWVVVSCRQS